MWKYITDYDFPLEFELCDCVFDDRGKCVEISFVNWFEGALKLKALRMNIQIFYKIFPQLSLIDTKLPWNDEHFTLGGTTVLGIE